MSLHWYAHHMGDYSNDTKTLSMLEHGAYRLLLDYYYANKGPIPVDQKAINRACHAVTPPERRAVEKVLLKYFTREDGVWHHRRADEEIEKANEISDIRRKAASKCSANAQQMHTQPQPTTTTYNQGVYNNGHGRRKKTGGEVGEELAAFYRSRSKEPA